MNLPSTGTLRTFHLASDLPDGWDSLCVSLLQTKPLLGHYEETNPCGQRYHGWFVDGEIVAGAVAYDFTLDLFTFFKGLRCPVRASMIGLPASIPPAGLVGQAPHVQKLLMAIFEQAAGLTVALNLRPGQVPDGCRAVRLLPDMIIRRRFDSLAGYERALRATWRRRMARVRRDFSGVTRVRGTCSGFTADHHDLYLQVRERAEAALETLSLEFFRGLPEPFQLVSHFAEGRLICWRIVLTEGERATFVLGGHDYRAISRYQSYFNNLYGLLDDAFASGAGTIDLGQTAEDPKGRLGAEPVETMMILHHGRRWLDRVVQRLSPLLAYRTPCPDYRVFRREELIS